VFLNGYLRYGFLYLFVRVYSFIVAKVWQLPEFVVTETTFGITQALSVQ
jgi:hypothetical protein